MFQERQSSAVPNTLRSQTKGRQRRNLGTQQQGHHFTRAVLADRSLLEWVKEGTASEKVGTTTDNSFKRFCCKGEQRKRTEDKEGYDIQGGLLFFLI